MSNIQITLVLLAAYWAGTNVVFTGIKIVNEARDKIISGCVQDVKLTIEQRKQIMRFDWFPAIGALGGISILLGIILVFLPQFGNRNETISIFTSICMLAAIMPFGGALFFLIRGILEFRFLNKTLKGDVGV